MSGNTPAEKRRKIITVKTHKNSAKVDCRWAIGLLFSDGIKFVTRADNSPKYFYWEAGKEPLYFESKQTADDYAFGMAVNGYPAVVMEIPTSFSIKNESGDKDAEKTNEAQ